MLAAHILAQTAETANGVPAILCLLLLIGAIISTVLVLLALIGIGPFNRGNTAAGGGFGPASYGPIIAAVVLWVLYVVLCN